MRVFSQQVPVEVVVIVQVTGVALITFIFGYFFSIEVITLITICTLLSGFVFWLKQEDDVFGLIDLLMWSYAVFILTFLIAPDGTLSQITSFSVIISVMIGSTYMTLLATLFNMLQYIHQKK